MKNALLFLALCFYSFPSFSQDNFAPLDVYDLEFATQPQFSPDGKQIIYARSFMDIMTDRRLSNLWITDISGKDHRPLTTGNHNQRSPLWSPDGKKIAYLSNESGKTQIHMLWLDNGQSAKISNLQTGVSNLKWSPDGRWLAFTMRVKKDAQSFGNMPKKPKGAKWADAPKYIDRLVYRSDGSGYVEESYNHIFVMPTEGGSPRQISNGDFNHSNPEWSKNSQSIFCSANRQKDWEYDQRNSEIYSIDLLSNQYTPLTKRYGPDGNPSLSPNGEWLAYTGYDDKKMGNHLTRIHLMKTDGSEKKALTKDIDLSFGSMLWDDDGKGLYVFYNEKGNSKVGHLNLNGELNNLANNLGSSSIGRPYSGGQFDVANGNIAFTQSTPEQPSELALYNSSTKATSTLSNLNDDILPRKKLAQVKEKWFESSFDGRKIQGWVMTPPDFDSKKKYPLILEIHGGPFTNYGDRFSPELQLLANAGYVVLYTNPRGSTSYGKEFADLIHHNYPSNDYDDLMSGVDAVIKEGYIDTDRLFVTGGSGGGVLTSWIIGKTDRFAAAVVAKPVINWYSWALTSDIAGVVDYWFPGKPWDHQEHYMKRSPISLVGNVKTPTMLLTGEQDYRTPISESEQYYQALKMQKVPAAMVRIQGASHGIAAKPSNLLAKVSYILAWFEKYDKGGS